MKTSLIAAAVCAATLTFTACGGSPSSPSAEPNPSGKKVSTSYSQEDFLRDIKAAGWKPDSLEGIPESWFYSEALQACNNQKGSPSGSALNNLEELLRFNKSKGTEPPDADVDAYMAAVKKTCGLK